MKLDYYKSVRTLGAIPEKKSYRGTYNFNIGVQTGL